MARICAASARQAAIAAPRSRSAVGAGQSSQIASSEAAAAVPQPARRSGIAEAGAAIETGRMSASSRETVAPASTELTTPEKRIPSATTAVTATAVHVEREASVPTHTRHAPASPSAACDPSRVRIGPVKSTRSSIENEPNAAKTAKFGFPTTFSPTANAAGITIAPRPARRSAARFGSRLQDPGADSGERADHSRTSIRAGPPPPRSPMLTLGRFSGTSARARRPMIETETPPRALSSVEVDSKSTARRSFETTIVVVATVVAAVALWKLKVLVALLLAAFAISAAMRPGVDWLARRQGAAPGRCAAPLPRAARRVRR